MGVIFFNHKVGDGLHYVNDNFIVHPNGDYQLGDTSDCCVLLNAQRLCTAFDLEPIWVYWSLVYPDDSMDQDDAATIIDQALPYTCDVDPTIPDNMTAIVEDLREVGCDGLADCLTESLMKKGIMI